MTGRTQPSELDQRLGIVRAAIRAVPATKYALGTAGVAAAAAISVGLLGNPTAAVVGVTTTLALSTVLLLFANLARQKPATFRRPAAVLLWTMTWFFVAATAALFSSFFFGFPLSFKPTEPHAPASSHTPSPQILPDAKSYFYAPSPPPSGDARSAGGLALVRAEISRTDAEPSMPVLDITIRNAGDTVAVITSARVRTVSRWWIGPTWIAPASLPVSHTYNVSVPALNGEALTTSLSQELRPQTADRFRLILGSGAADGAWDPPIGLFVFLLDVELEYNEDRIKLSLPQVYTHIPPPQDVVASTHFAASREQVQAALDMAVKAQASIPQRGIVDPQTMEALGKTIEQLEKALER